MSLRTLLNTLLCRVLPVGITTVLCGAVLFVTTAFFLPDTYSASVVLSVRNRTNYENGISNADLAASEMLVEPCIALLREKTEPRISVIFEKHGAGIFAIQVTGTDADAVRIFAAALTADATEQLAGLVNAASVSVIKESETSILPRKTARNTVIGLAAGFALGTAGVLYADAVSRKNREKKAV